MFTYHTSTTSRKLVAQLKNYGWVEPLPDIDFSIRAGNTLVSFTAPLCPGIMGS